MRSGDQFHVGIVVDDLDRALGDLTESFGYRWADEIHVDQPVQLPDGPTTVEFRFRYSCDEPHVEVIEARAGTLWVPARDSGIHHLGYWSDDLAADADALGAAGYEFEATGDGPDGSPMWSYHRSPNGPRIELVDRAIEPLMAALWSTGTD